MNEAISTLENREKQIQRRILVLNSANILSLNEEAKKLYNDIMDDERQKQSDLLAAIKIVKDTFK